MTALHPRTWKHSPALIRAILDDARTMSGPQVAAKHGVHHRSVYRWLRHAEQHPEWPTDADVAAWETWRTETAAAREDRRVKAAEYRRRVYLQRGPQHVDPVGTRRRLQALACNGWLFSEIGEQLGVGSARISQLATGHWKAVHRDTAAHVADLYDRWSMVIPPELPRRPKGPLRRARQRAQATAKGWAPPLAWDDAAIDDPAARPHGVRDDRPLTRTAAAAERLATLRELHALGRDLDDVCRHLDLSRDTLAVWCRRHDVRDLYLDLERRLPELNEHAHPSLSAHRGAAA